MGIQNLRVFLLTLVAAFHVTVASIVLTGRNVTLYFDDIQASFTPSVKESGECGVLYLAEPLDACSELRNNAKQYLKVKSPFVLIIRGGCGYEDKVRRAQNAGFEAAIVYDNEGVDRLVAMAGDSTGITMPSVFISRASGELLKNYAGLTDMDLRLIPAHENTAWLIMAISFICLLAIAAMVATFFFIRRHQIRREMPEASYMSKSSVKEMPSLIFTVVTEDNCTSSACSICLEDYNVGEKLRVLPCHHKFHAFCVDIWLTSWRTFCPVCKRDARTRASDPPASESTSLISSRPGSIASILSSRSSLLPSPSIQILPAPWRSVSHRHSFARIPHVRRSLRSHYQSPLISGRSFIDHRYASQRSLPSDLASPPSFSHPSVLSPLSSRNITPHIMTSSNASVSTHGSLTSHDQHPLRYSATETTFSPLSSTHSLPEC